MSKLNIGDLFLINTPIGKALFQFIFNNETFGELIRVLPGVYEKIPENIEEIVNGKESYFIHFPVKAAKRLKIIELISNIELPKGMEIPTQFRSPIVNQDGVITGWHIIDYETWKRETFTELTEEQKKLSPWGTWNDTLLVERIIQDWTLEIWG